MSKPKHTPGPWTVESVPANWGIYTTPVTYVIHGHTMELLPKDTITANEQLIAAAPELVKALEYIRTDIQDPFMKFDRDAIVERYVAFINHVLRKAGGDHE
jgi:hypothetical protein